jgi:hypothetical protein
MLVEALFFLIKILTSWLPSFVFPPSQTYFSFLAFSISPFFFFLLDRVNQHPPMHQLVVLSMGCRTYQLTIDPSTYLPFIFSLAKLLPSKQKVLSLLG